MKGYFILNISIIKQGSLKYKDTSCDPTIVENCGFIVGPSVSLSIFIPPNKGLIKLSKLNEVYEISGIKFILESLDYKDI